MANEQKVIFTNDICSALSDLSKEIHHDRLFMLFDTETMKNCMPLLTTFMNDYDAAHPASHLHTIVIEATDVAKNIESLTEVWTSLSDTSWTKPARRAWSAGRPSCRPSPI